MFQVGDFNGEKNQRRPFFGAVRARGAGFFAQSEGEPGKDGVLP